MEEIQEKLTVGGQCKTIPLLNDKGFSMVFVGDVVLNGVKFMHGTIKSLKLTFTPGKF